MCEDKDGNLFKCNEPYIISLKMFKWCYDMYNIFALKECQREINIYMFYGVFRSSIKQHHYNVWKGDRQKRLNTNGQFVLLPSSKCIHKLIFDWYILLFKYFVFL